MTELEKGLTRYLSEDRLAKLKQVKVGIAGAGGLGSNCAVCLVRTGVRHLVIADFDQVEASNLNRQFYFARQIGMPKVEALRQNLLAIDPEVDVEIFPIRLTSENIHSIFSETPVVVEAFDRAEEKRMLVEELLPTGKMVVAASGLAGYDSSDGIVVRKMHKNLQMVGDGESEVGDGKPPLAARVMVAAAKQAETVIRHLWGDC